LPSYFFYQIYLTIWSEKIKITKSLQYLLGIDLNFYSQTTNFRWNIAEAFEKQVGRLSPEDDERLQLAKRKMLGNIQVSNLLCAFLSNTL